MSNSRSRIEAELLHESIDRDMRFWRKRICDATFYFFSFVGILTYVPSLILSIREGVYINAALSTVLYGYCVVITFLKRVNYTFKAVSGTVLFFIVGVELVYVLGPRGAGVVWLFSTTLLAGLLLGNVGATVAFVANSIAQVVFYFLLRHEALPWFETAGIDLAAWIVQGINFILLNLCLLVASAVITKGFRLLITRSIETRNASIIGLAKLAEFRDNETGGHLRRIQLYSVMLAQKLSRKATYRGYITVEFIEDLRISSILHDIGKVGIQDAILLKPDSLTDSEFATIKQHPVIGADVIAEIERNLGGRSLYTLAKDIALYHHERWDGAGYPEGLSGDEIPLSARIVALVDVYDALTSRRVYKGPVSHEEAVSVVIEGRGSQFDPDVVDAFLAISSEFAAVRRQYDSELADQLAVASSY